MVLVIWFSEGFSISIWVFLKDSLSMFPSGLVFWGWVQCLLLGDSCSCSRDFGWRLIKLQRVASCKVIFGRLGTLCLGIRCVV